MVWLESVRGGNMKHGFLAAAAGVLGGEAIMKYGANWGKAVKVAANAIVGGTAAELGGGKFANGAITGAFIMLYNDLMEHDPPEKENNKEDKDKQADDGFGNTFSERIKNPKLWKKIGYDFLFGSERPEVIQISFADNPISLLAPFSTMPKSAVGLKVALGGSKNTLVSTAFYHDLGIKGFYGRKIWTPYGYARSWETLLGRWTGTVTAPIYINKQIKKLNKDD